MDKTILKKFAIESRQDLMDKIKNKINTFYVDEDFKSEQRGDLYILSNDKNILSLTNDEYKKRELLIKRINELGIEQVIEEVAYTWFNRIVAIRYMEINDYLPLTKDNQSLGIRVLSSKDNTPDPEILKFTNLTNSDLDIDFKKEKYAELKDDNEKFKYVLLLVCKKLGRVIPQVFDGVTDYIDILIPDNLLNDTGFITKVINEVPENNYNQVEIIGWLYQFYISERHDYVVDPLHGKSFKRDDIAAATQLFTTDWVVKYMVENSLGKYWIEHTNNKELQKNWRYYIESEYTQKAKKDIKEVEFIDPCCGSGHILVYAFELFYQIYLSEGYGKSEIPNLILKNNLYGLDIDDRAGQLSILSLLLKAREYDKNIFNRDITKNLNIMSIKESNSFNDENSIDSLNDNLKNKVIKLKKSFYNAKEYGSLIELEDEDYSDLINYIDNNYNLDTYIIKNNYEDIVKLYKILSKKYEIVVTNPPYLNKLSPNLKKFVNEKFKKYSNDLFSVFMYRNLQMCNEDGYCAYMTPNVWMSIKSYEDLRDYIIHNKSITSLIQMAHGAFNQVACVDVCCFVIRNTLTNEKGTYIKLSDFIGGMEEQEERTLYALNNKCDYLFNVSSSSFAKIPGDPITAFAATDKMRDIYSKATLLEKVAYPKQGIATSNNDKFVRYWFEVDRENIFLNCKNHSESSDSSKKWYPYNKGGIFRKWYGNNDRVINWQFDGAELKKYEGAVLRNPDFYFKESISWSLISSYTISFRYKEIGSLFDVAGMCCFPSDKVPLLYLLALNNSCLIGKFMLMLAPTINYQVGNISNIPVIYDRKYEEEICNIAKKNIDIVKSDWDNYEISWNYNIDPIVKISNGKEYIEESYSELKKKYNNTFDKLVVNEERLNEIFLDIYDVKEEFSKKVNKRDISLTSIYDYKKDIPTDIKVSYYVRTKRDVIINFISYFVGCLFGRYKLGGVESIIDKDNIIPITDEPYFSDDIVEKFKKFLIGIYGNDTLNKNIDFIAEALEKRGTETSEERIRRYFNDEFYSDHLKIYQKHPIYWLFDSGKKNGFKALIYMHRFNENLIPKLRLDYLHRVQTTYEKLLSDVNYKLTTELSLSDKKDAQNRQADLNAKLNEIKEYDEKIAHIANQRINIDLDDGVKVNYDKFKDILAKIK